MHALFRSILLAITLLAASFVPQLAHAQSGEWREYTTANFTILYVVGEEGEAERYRGFIDTIYDEISTAFNYRAPPPLTLRLYPTSDAYYQVNPAARHIPGIVAHADFRRRELVVIVERTLQQSEEEVRNNVRHELTHIVAADLSKNRLNTGFQEGIAQYVERAAPDLDLKIANLRLAADQGRLLPWSAFDDRDLIYGNPELTYPQTLSVVAFLVDRAGLATLRQFLATSAENSGYRSALEQTYGLAARDLEAAWLQWLPSYLSSGYRINALDSYDLTYARTLVTQGNYAAAITELEQALDWMAHHADTQSSEVVAVATQLKAQAEDGVTAMQLAESARVALTQGDYMQAQQLLDQARPIFARIADTRQDAVLAIYSERAQRGIIATAQLTQADTLARSLRLLQARTVADMAAQEFAAIGDQIQLTNALELRDTLERRQRFTGTILLGLGLVGVLISLVGRFFQPPSEVW